MRRRLEHPSARRRPTASGSPVLIAGACLVVAATALPAGARATPIGDQIVVRQRASLSLGERAELRADAGVTLDERLPLTGVDVVVSQGDRAAALQALRADPGVLWAEPSREVTALTADPDFAKQYGLENLGATGLTDADIDAPTAWTVSRGAGVTVGVVDTKVDTAHPDLAGQFEPTVDLTAPDPTVMATPDEGMKHATHVAGIIAADENAIGGVGVAPLAKVKNYRALDDDGKGSTQNIALAFSLAAQAGIRVVNASLGGAASNVEEQAIAAHPGTLYVVAAGNDAVNVEDGAHGVFPCDYDYANVLCVGASDDRDRRASFSNYGTRSVDLSAPGAAIWSTLPGGAYGYLSGTSMASPMAAGAAALVASAHPDWGPVQIKAALLGTVDQPSTLAPYTLTGGRVNAARALGIDVGPDGRAPGAVGALTAIGADHALTLSWRRPTDGDVAGFTIQRSSDGAWSTAASAAPGDATATITGLTPGATETVRVVTRDRSGMQSIPSAQASAVIGDRPPPAPVGVDPVPTPTPPAVVVPPPATSTPVQVTVARARLSGVHVLTRRGRPTGIAFRLSDSGPVAIRAERRRGAGLRARTVRTALTFTAGAQTVRLGRGRGALDLNRGTWRLTVTGPTGRGTLTLKIR